MAAVHAVQEVRSDYLNAVDHLNSSQVRMALRTGTWIHHTFPVCNHLAIGYARGKLTDFAKNYTPFLLEMQGALWGIEHFQYYQYRPQASD